MRGTGGPSVSRGRAGGWGWLVLALIAVIVPVGATASWQGRCLDGVDPLASFCESAPAIGWPAVVALWVAWVLLFALAVARVRRTRRSGRRRSAARGSAPATGALATVEVSRPPAGFRLDYAPRRNGEPDAGEVVWAWVPYEEDPSQGKDRPLLVIGRADTTHVFALKLTSRERDGARDHVPIGSGPWDASGRPSWVDVDQVYRLHRYGIRREAAPLPRESFERLADILARRHG